MGKYLGPEKGRLSPCERRDDDLSLLLGLLWQEDSLNVGQNTTLGDGHSREKFVQLLVVADGELEMTRNDPGLLVVTSGIACQLENFSGQVFHDGCEIHGCTGTNSLGVISFPQQTMDTSDRELKSSTARTGLGLSLDFSSFSSSGHG